MTNRWFRRNYRWIKMGRWNIAWWSPGEYRPLSERERFSNRKRLDFAGWTVAAWKTQ